MTLLMVLLDRQTFLVHKSELEPEQLARKIQCGDWSFADWEDIWISQRPRQAAAFAGLVIVAESLPVQPAPVTTGPQMDVYFSRRQREILECLMQGMTARQIALRLKISKRTADQHLAAIRKKLETRTNSQSLGQAVALGYWKPKRKA